MAARLRKDRANLSRPALLIPRSIWGPVNIIDAAHKTVHSYPGGSESLGPRIGMSPAVLRNKVNPNNTTHHLTLVEADEIMGVTGDYRILQALAGQHGYVLQPMGSEGEAGNVLSAVLETNSCEGSFAETLQQALKDNLISQNEWRLLCDAGAKVQSAMLTLLGRLREQVPNHQVKDR
jgi:hypothetical protein